MRRATASRILALSVKFNATSQLSDKEANEVPHALRSSQGSGSLVEVELAFVALSQAPKHSQYVNH